MIPVIPVKRGSNQADPQYFCSLSGQKWEQTSVSKLSVILVHAVEGELFRSGKNNSVRFVEGQKGVLLFLTRADGSDEKPRF